MAKLPYIIRPVLLDINPDRQGKCAIKICAYERKTQKRTYRDTEHRVKPDHWNDKDRHVKRSAPDYQSINLKLQNQVKEIEDKIRQLIEDNKPVNIARILEGDSYNEANVFEFAEKYLAASNLKPATIEARKLDMKRLKEYSGPGLTFEQVDRPFLRHFSKHLRGYLANNSVHRVFKSMKAIFNAAIGDQVTTNYPFKGNKENPKYIQTERTFLTQPELDKFVKHVFTLKSVTMRIAGLLFGLGAYSSLRVSDWFRFFEDPNQFIHDGQLILYTKKTGDPVSMPIEGTLKKIINELLKLQAAGNECPTEQTINEYIRIIAGVEGVEIKKHLTTHVARHTYGCRCANNGIPPALAAERMGITEKTVLVYYHIMGATVKEAFKKMDKQ